MTADRTNRSHAAKVAAVATLLVMGCYVIGVVILNIVVIHRLTTEVDGRLSSRLAESEPADPAGTGNQVHSEHPDEVGISTMRRRLSGRLLHRGR